MKSGYGAPYVFVLATLMLLLVTQSLSANDSVRSGSKIHPRFGTPDSVENLLESDRADKDVLFESRFFTPYFEWKDSMTEKYGFSFGTEYTAVYLASNVSLPGRDD